MTSMLRAAVIGMVVVAARMGAAADVPVRYTVTDTDLKGVPAATPLTFTLYSDAGCTTQTHNQVITLQDVTIIERLRRLTPSGGARPPKTDELHATLTGVTPAPSHYLSVTGPGILPVGATCQVQAGGAGAAGWIDAGSAVHLATDSDSVGIGTQSPSASLHVAGTALFKNVVDGVNAYAFQSVSGAPLLSISTLEETSPSTFEPFVKVGAQGTLFQPYLGETDHVVLVYTANGFDLFRVDSAGRRVIVGPAENDASLVVAGDLIVSGTKSFVQAHPADPAKDIVYAALEGGEAGTYFRGSGTLAGGEAVIELPEHFTLTTAAEGLTAQLTPKGEWLQLYVRELSPKRLVVREASQKNGRFDYLVQGVRSGYENYQVVRKRAQTPSGEPIARK